MKISFIFPNHSSDNFIVLINIYLSLACKQANISKKFTFHVSRHSFATLSLNMGIPLDALCSLLGHSDIKTTMIYAKMLDQTKVDLMKKWDYVQ